MDLVKKYLLHLPEGNVTMTREELEWLDRYHAAVLRELGAYLNKEEGAWLEKACAPVAR